jgi:hypothetical protein
MTLSVSGLTRPVPKQLSAQRVSEAQTILRSNDRGGYTIPTAGLYPFQWNWDASICALGWATFSVDRALQEFECLLSAVWSTPPQRGLLGSIVFHQDADSYFPGPDQWGTQGLRTPASSSISQPPLHATLLRAVVGRALDAPQHKARVRALLPALMAHHHWWYGDRDPAQTGLVINVHPWETGMDNSPAWDAALARVPAATRPFTRKDLGHIDPAMRPRQSDYDRYVTLMDVQRECGFESARILQATPYAMNDIGIISILHRATLDLIALCEAHDYTDGVLGLRARATRTEAAITSLWSESLQQFVSADGKSHEQVDIPTHAGLLPLYGRLAGPKLGALLATIEAWLDETPYAVPSTRSRHAAFEPMRYWRGPVWLHMNWMIAEGCLHYGRQDLHDRIHDSTLQLIEAEGYREYYHPLTGKGLGGGAFSWAAATALFWLQ